jgi:uncharacterized protein with HEPN domain
VGLRHRIIHEYFGVDIEIIWKIVEKDIIVFKENIHSLLKEYRN